MEGLLLDIEKWSPNFSDKEIVSIYFGGGTPSLLGAKALSKLLDKIKQFVCLNLDQIEITLEANPENVSADLMREYKDAGVNRISLGVQSLDDSLLKKLGRTHYAKAAIEAVLATERAGINNISIDLMYDIPCQTLAAWKETLHQAVSLPIMHLSLYNLTIEPHTVFFKYREILRKQLPDEECSAQMYETAVDTLQKNGLMQYEISAFARDRNVSRHNTGYWLGRPFLGFGPSAFSYWQGKRFRAVSNLNKYVEMLRSGDSPIDFSEELDPKERRRELLAIALRLIDGVDCVDFEMRHGAIDCETNDVLNRLLETGLLRKKGNVIALTERGRIFYDTIAAEIV